MILSLYGYIIIISFFMFFYLNFKIDCFSSMPHIHVPRGATTTEINVSVSKKQRRKEKEKKEKTVMGSTLTSDKYFRKISRRTARFHDEEFRSYFVSDAISGPPSRGIIHVLLPSSLTRGKGLNNVARHKGQVSCAAKHSWHFCEKRTESLSVLPPGS